MILFYFLGLLTVEVKVIYMKRISSYLLLMVSLFTLNSTNAQKSITGNTVSKYIESGHDDVKAFMIETESHKELYSIDVYPNPTTSYIVIGLGDHEDLYEAVIMESSTGRLIKRIGLKDKIQILDMEQYSSGLYILQLIDRYGEIRDIKKVIKE